MPHRLLYETHMHTPLCGHADGLPEDYAEVADARGLAGIIVTCHNPMPDGYSAAVRMAPEQFDEYVAMVDSARATWAGRVDVRLGLEADYAPGFETYLEDQMTWAEFHYVLASVHPHVAEYMRRYFTGDVLTFQKLYFEHLALAAETGLFDAISHPDLIKNSFPEQWDLDRVMDDVRRSLDRIARAGTAMELNTSGLNKSVPEMNPGPAILSEMKQRGIPVVIGADAHVPRRTGEDFRLALRHLKDAGYNTVSLFLNRKRREIDLDAALASLSRAEPRAASR